MREPRNRAPFVSTGAAAVAADARAIHVPIFTDDDNHKDRRESWTAPGVVIVFGFLIITLIIIVHSSHSSRVSRRRSGRIGYVSDISDLDRVADIGNDVGTYDTRRRPPLAAGGARTPPPLNHAVASLLDDDHPGDTEQQGQLPRASRPDADDTADTADRAVSGRGRSVGSDVEAPPPASGRAASHDDGSGEDVTNGGRGDEGDGDGDRASGATVRRPDTYNPPAAVVDAYESLLANYTRFVAAPVGEVLEQSSARFKDFPDIPGDGMASPWPRGIPAGAEGGWSRQGSEVVYTPQPIDDDPAVWGACETRHPLWFGNGYQLTTSDGVHSLGKGDGAAARGAFGPGNDTTCLRYLSNIANIASVKSMGSILSTGRTIKFKLTYRHPPPESGREPIRAVVKVSQYKFLLEPCAEYAAFTVDRALEFRRVPPTAWLWLPGDWLRAAAAARGHFYSHWLEGFVMQYRDVVPLLSPKVEAAPSRDEVRAPTATFVPASAQLWIENLKHYSASSLAAPYTYAQVMDLGGQAGPPSSRQGKWRMGEAVDTMVLDYVITNQDRGLFRNNAAWGDTCRDGVAGASCRAGGDVNAPLPNPAKNDLPGFGLSADDAAVARAASVSRCVWIDQGSSFYRRPGPQGNPFTAVSGQKACRIRRRTFNALTSCSSDGATPLSTLLGVSANAQHQSARRTALQTTPWSPAHALGLPPTLVQCIRPALLAAAQQRVDDLVKHFRRDCLAGRDEADIFAFEDDSLPVESASSPPPSL
eukprot:TRINITY_DN9870_c0_g1_i1.p1 TRINITY_DN9870_c0_g1~~TRINITY_DN9870_c0_g1_i1.p1  ORF type:complete len:767 (-),score=150.42 TRINITY_DN9870_c0_g1_i1:99-2378(-)